MNSYNPLEKKNLAESVVNELLGVDVMPLENLAPFEGAGVYVIYYVGDFEAYAPFRNDATKGDFDKPIYVGKAIPTGGRKGGNFFSPAPGRALYGRLKEHLESVQEATNLNSHDFYFRRLVVDDIWIPLGESLLITTYQPVWNKVLDGFGNHDPGAGRYNQKRSQWDTLHPGRSWAEKCQPGKYTVEELLTIIRAKAN